MFVSSDVMARMFVVTPIEFSVWLNVDIFVRFVDTDDAFIESVLDPMAVEDTALSDVGEVLATEVDDILNELETEVSCNGVFCDADVTGLAVDVIKDSSNNVVVVGVIVVVFSDCVSKFSVVCRSLESV